MNLRKLMQNTDAAIEVARAAGIGGSVNWGDLSCIEVEAGVTSEGDTFLRVIVSEAATDAHELQEFIGNHLLEHAGVIVEVKTEW